MYTASRYLVESSPLSVLSSVGRFYKMTKPSAGTIWPATSNSVFNGYKPYPLYLCYLIPTTASGSDNTFNGTKAYICFCSTQRTGYDVHACSFQFQSGKACQMAGPVPVTCWPFGLAAGVCEVSGGRPICLPRCPAGARVTQASWPGEMDAAPVKVGGDPTPF